MQLLQIEIWGITMKNFRLSTCWLLFAMAGLGFAQKSSQPITNADVVKMVKSGLPESVIVTAIQSRPGKFDISPNALIAMKKSGVTSAEMDAMVARSSGAKPHSASPAVAASSSATDRPAAKFHLPTVALLQDGSSQPLTLEKTQLAETKTKPTSMKSLAGDSVLTQGIQAGIGTATATTAMHINSSIGSSGVQQAGTIFSGMMAHRKPTVTYVWGVPNPASANALQTASPTFSVDFSRTPGINLDDYEPAIVKLTPAQNTCRIIGATQGKEDATSSPAADWQIYSHFLEERVPATPKKLAPGKFEIAPKSDLAFGEYAVVLRPLSKSKNYSGADVARGQGDGLMFDSVWSFQISPDSAQ